MKRWLRQAKKLIADNWQSLLDWYLERERLRQIRKREELGDL
jgi:hypothetical protein